VWDKYSPCTKGETAITKKSLLPKLPLSKLERLITSTLDKHKAERIVSIDLTGKSDFADCMIVASGTSGRHVGSLADNLVSMLKDLGIAPVPTEGKEACEWVLVDVGDIIVHLFKPEVRTHYNLEKMWSVALPDQLEAAH